MFVVKIEYRQGCENLAYLPSRKLAEEFVAIYQSACDTEMKIELLPSGLYEDGKYFFRVRIDQKFVAEAHPNFSKDDALSRLLDIDTVRLRFITWIRSVPAEVTLWAKNHEEAEKRAKELLMSYLSEGEWPAYKETQLKYRRNSLEVNS